MESEIKYDIPAKLSKLEVFLIEQHRKAQDDKLFGEIWIIYNGGTVKNFVTKSSADVLILQGLQK